MFIPPFFSQVKCFLLTVLPVLIAGCTCFSQNPSKKIYGRQAYMMVKVLDKYHYQPININDELSARIYKHFLEKLDPFGVYFTEKDIQKLSEWKTKLDDEIRAQSSVFIVLAAALYREKLLLADTTVGEMLSKPMDFSTPDSLSFYSAQPGEVEYAEDETALKKRWSKWLKYQVLAALFTTEKENEDPFSADIKTILQKEPDARKKILIRNKRSIKRKMGSPEGFEDQVAIHFLNALAFCYDPHTEFFSPSGRQEFQQSLSKEEYSLGLYLGENENGEVVISHLVPGGAAWKSNQLHKGDVLLKVEHSRTIVTDLSNLTAEEAESILASIIPKSVELTVRTAGGQVKKITLVKTKVASEENVVKSYILNEEKKIGYISLPSFYTDWESDSPLGCANDVAKEIVKLQEEGIQGLILDLRFNGGGSVGEAIALAGIFINEGPLAIRKMRDDKPRLLKDMNRGTAYNGPLLVMVNGLSASASEMFSASMQDYNRAVIAGSSTYGKGTGQVIIPIDTGISMEAILTGVYMSKENKLGFVKVTMEKFYRVTNSTCQKAGVTPDVFLPYPYMYDDYRESVNETCLSKDSVVKKVLYTPLPELPLKQVASASNERVKKDKNYLRLNRINDSLKTIEKEDTPVPLNPEGFRKAEKGRYLLYDAMEEVMSDSTLSLKAVNNKYDLQVDKMDEDSRETNEILLKNMSRDIYIQECCRVLADLIKFGK